MSANLGRQTTKVYLVEDSLLIRERLAAMVRTLEGIEIVGEAEAPEAALLGIKASRPDVVILDLQLTAGSGLSVLRQLHDVAPDVVPIVLTNDALPQFRKECLAAGAKYFFDKTTEFGKVCGAIEAVSRH
jgi:two-component system, NarL family, response regulator DevR